MITITAAFFVQNPERVVLLREYAFGFTPSWLSSSSAAEGADTRMDSATSSTSWGASAGPIGPSIYLATVLAATTTHLASASIAEVVLV